MAVIDRAGQRYAAGVGDAVAPILGWFREAVADDFWEWFRENPERRILKVRKWVFHFTVRVRHLEGLFEILFGPPRYRP